MRHLSHRSANLAVTLPDLLSPAPIQYRAPHSKLGYLSPVHYAAQLSRSPTPVGLRPTSVAGRQTRPTTTTSTHHSDNSPSGSEKRISTIPFPMPVDATASVSYARIGFGRFIKMWDERRALYEQAVKRWIRNGVPSLRGKFAVYLENPHDPENGLLLWFPTRRRMNHGIWLIHNNLGIGVDWSGSFSKLCSENSRGARNIRSKFLSEHGIDTFFCNEGRGKLPPGFMVVFSKWLERHSLRPDMVLNRGRTLH